MAWTDSEKQRFIQSLLDAERVEDAILAASIPRTTAYRWLRSPAFQEEVADARNRRGSMDFSTVPVDKILKMPVGELNAHIAHMEAVLEVFQTVRRRLSAGGEPPASQPAAVAKKAKIAADKPKVKPKAKPTEREPIPMRILDELAFKIGVFLKANGPKRSDSIKNHLGCSDHELHEALKASAWFEKANGMYTLTSDGHVHFNGDR